MAEQHCDDRHCGCRDCHLQAAEAQQFSPHRPQQVRFELEPDEKEHHDDTELGEVLDADDVDMQSL